MRLGQGIAIQYRCIVVKATKLGASRPTYDIHHFIPCRVSQAVAYLTSAYIVVAIWSCLVQ